MMSCWVKMEEELGFRGDMRVVEDHEWRKGPWSGDEDKLLTHYVQLHGQGRWNCVARLTGLKRNGKSCRLRWVNYLRPDLKRSQITPHEETVILDLHARWGNRWSTIARSLPGRTDNEIKNYWRTHFKNKMPGQLPPHRRSSRDKKQQQLPPLPGPSAAAQMPTNTNDHYSTLILNNIPQFQFQDDDDMIWDIGSLWDNLQQEIDHNAYPGYVSLFNPSVST